MSSQEELQRENAHLKQKLEEQEHSWRQEVSTGIKDIHTRLGVIETAQARHQSDSTLALSSIAEEVSSIREEAVVVNTIVLGNGEPEKGLVVRTDRLEQQHKTLSSLFYVILPISITALGSALWSWITGKPPSP